MGLPEPLPEQRKFIERDSNEHALLVAGPGTGKTFTIEWRARFLVEQCGVDPDGIALLTLTKSLVESLAERVPYGRAQTFHSFALVWLNRLGEAWDRRVVAPEDVEDLVRLDLQHGVQLAFDVTIPRDRIGKFIGRLSAAFRDEQDAPPDMSPEEQRLFQVFQHQRELFRYRLMDELAFDLIRLIEQGADLAGAPTHILCDEYQDFTPGELRLLQLFAERFGTVVEACGDDRQSIFRFRAADPLALHRFPAVYGLDEPDYLWRSSRCPQTVCDLANRMAEALPPLEGLERPQLEPWEGREDLGNVELIAASSPITEARWIVRRCAAFLEEGFAAEEIMVVASGFIADVVASLNHAASEIEDLPFAFYDPRNRSPFAGDAGVRLLSAGARLLVSGEDQMAWRRLAAETPGLGTTRLKRILVAGEATYLRGLRVVAESDAVCARPLAGGDAVLAQYGGQDEVVATEIVELLVAELGIEGLDIARVNELAAQGESATPSEWFRRIVDAGEDTQVDPADMPGSTPVITIFGAKGLQARVVFLANALTPSFIMGGEIADGIRRAYVGVTRAQQHLLVSAPLYLEGSTLAHKIDAHVGGLAEVISIPAGQLGIDVQQIRADDVGH
jgi:superfamily I DNA/RNA helicase